MTTSRSLLQPVTTDNLLPDKKAAANKSQRKESYPDNPAGKLLHQPSPCLKYKKDSNVRTKHNCDIEPIRALFYIHDDDNYEVDP